MNQSSCCKKRFFRVFFSFQKERAWLEEMAGKGWFLSNLTLGMIFTFVKGEPKKMLYDVDRFSLPKKPGLEEIRRKELFFELAQEMGWQEVTHDESMNYYFAKEYEEDGVNELCNDEDSRRYRAQKFKEIYHVSAKRFAFCVMVVAAVSIWLKLVLLTCDASTRLSLQWYDWFVLIYVCVANGQAVAAWRRGVRCERELSMTRQEWEDSVNPATHKVVKKLILTNRGLNRFLSRQAAEGWILTEVTPVRYFFEKSCGEKMIYTMDSKYLVNQRRKARDQRIFSDGKDWNGMNSDWELQSVHDAEERGWSFACALENRSIIYKGEEGKVQPLNDGRYDNSLRSISLVGQYGAYMILSGILGGIVGLVIGMLTP